MCIQTTVQMFPSDGSGVLTGISSVPGTRKYQQDAAGTAIDGQNNKVAVLCDGMGGMKGGEIASSLCVNMVCNDFRNQQEKNIPIFLCREIYKADKAVSSLTDKSGIPINAGTTMLLAAISGNQLYWASVGDSRIYLIRDDEIVRVNTDHTYMMRLSEMVKTGELNEKEALSHPQKDSLISYIGMGAVRLVDVTPNPFLLRDQDYIVMCSDGLYKIMDESGIYKLIQEGPQDMQEMAALLTKAATDLALDGQDNTTVIIMKYIE